MLHSSNTHQVTKELNWRLERHRRDGMPTLVSEIQILLTGFDRPRLQAIAVSSFA